MKLNISLRDEKSGYKKKLVVLFAIVLVASFAVKVMYCFSIKCFEPGAGWEMGELSHVGQPIDLSKAKSFAPGGGGARAASDTFQYIAASDEILHGHFITFRTPANNPTANERAIGSIILPKYVGFPIYLALLRTVIGDGFDRLRWASMVLYSIVSVLVCYLAFKAFGMEAAYATAPFAVISPLMTFWSHFVLTESLFTFLLIVAITMLVEMVEKPKVKLIVPAIGGLAFGFACLTRPTLLPMGFILCLWAFIIKKKTRNYPGGMITYMSIAMLIYGSWVIRNELITGSHHIGFIEAAYTQKFFLNARTGADTYLGLDSQMHTLKGTAEMMFRQIFDAFTEYWNVSIAGSHQTFKDSRVIKIFVIFYSVTFVLMLFAGKYVRKNYKIFSLILMPMLYFTAVYTFSLAGGGSACRHRVPIEPYIYVMAGYSMFQVWSFVQSKVRMKRRMDV